MRNRISWQEAVPRIIADFLVVHVSMLASLAISVLYQVLTGFRHEPQVLIHDFTTYYTRFFWLLSPLFPLCFLAYGFYTHTRSYGSSRKNLAIIQGVTAAMLLFMIANLLVGGRTLASRSIVLPFAILAGPALCFSRMLKDYVVKHFDVKPKHDTPTTAGKPRVLVVGGAGYIGSLLVERLLELGFRVRILDALLYGKEPLRSFAEHPDCQLIVGDCRNICDVVKAVRGVDAIVDLAAIVGDPACEQDRGAALEINYAATRMMIEVAKGNGVTRFLFASSCSVYGATEYEVDERSDTKPISLYGRTKIDSERVLLAARSEEFHPTILRFATVFGLGYRPRFDLVINLLSARAIQDRTITIYNGQQWRPFIHVRDVVEAIVVALKAPARVVSGEIFNVGDSQLNYTLQEIAQIVQDILPGTTVEHIQNSDQRNYRVNFDKIRNRLGFRASYTIHAGIEEFKLAFESGVISSYKDVAYNNQRFLEATGTIGHKDMVDALVMAAFASQPDSEVKMKPPADAPIIAPRELLKAAASSAA